MNRIARRLKARNRLTLATLSGLFATAGAYLFTSNFRSEYAAVCLAVSAYFLLLLTLSYQRQDYCLVHPYFSKKLSSDLPRTAFNGHEIAAHLDELDACLHDNGLPTISDFGYQQTQIKKCTVRVIC